MNNTYSYIKWIGTYFPEIKDILIKKYSIANVISLISLLQTLIVGLLIESIFYQSNKTYVITQVVLYIVLIIVFHFLEKWECSLTKKLQYELQFMLRKRLYIKEIHLKPDEIKRIKSGENMQLYSSDVDNIYLSFNQTFKQITIAAFQIVLIFIISIYYNWKLAIVLSLFSICTVIFNRIFQKKYQAERKKFRKKTVAYLDWINEHLKGVVDIRRNQAESLMNELFMEKTKDNLKEKERIRFIEIRADRSVALISNIFTIIFWGAAAYLMLSKSLTVGLFYVMNEYFRKMTDCLNNIVIEKNNISGYQPSFERIKEIFSLEEENFDKGKKMKQIGYVGKLSINSVSFSFADQLILNNITAVFEPGKMNVIVGMNGAGKTTLFNLLLRFYSPDKGKITYGENDIEDYNLREWRNNIGYVQQENMIFEGSLKDNICLYAPKISEQEIWHILKIAGLYDIVSKWEKGLDTDLNKGQRLSEGQKQRVVISRIMAKTPEIVLMDEPTAFLDSCMEEKFIADIKEIYKHQILIIITHRKKVAELADQVYVMNNKRIEAFGEHKHLIENSQYYRQLFDI